jgi:hypothetical protein
VRFFGLADFPITGSPDFFVPLPASLSQKPHPP